MSHELRTPLNAIAGYVSLADAIADVACMVEPQFAAKGLTYSVNTARDVVRADREKLQQILLNLLSNAVKFTDRGGHVTVDTAEREGMSLAVVFLRVSDSGCGIPREKHEVIFDPFVQVSAAISAFAVQKVRAPSSRSCYRPLRSRSPACESEMAGDHERAIVHYRAAAERTTSTRSGTIIPPS